MELDGDNGLWNIRILTFSGSSRHNSNVLMIFRVYADIASCASLRAAVAAIAAVCGACGVMLCIVQYHTGVGLANNHLAFVRRHEEEYNYTFADARKHCGNLSEFNACAMVLDENVLQKKTFHAVFERDFQSLKDCIDGMDEMTDSDAAVSLLAHLCRLSPNTISRTCVYVLCRSLLKARICLMPYAFQRR